MEQKKKCDSPELGLGNGMCSDDLDGFSELNRQGDGVSQVGRVGGHLAREGSPPVSVKQSESRGKGESFGERVQRHRSLKNGHRHFVWVRSLRAGALLSLLGLWMFGCRGLRSLVTS
jgi:hypothetical protein